MFETEAADVGDDSSSAGFAMVLVKRPKSINSGSKERYKVSIIPEARVKIRGELLPGDLDVRIVWFHGGISAASDGDADNIGKSILDALRGIIYRDDQQVKQRLIHKVSSREPLVLMPNPANPECQARLQLIWPDRPGARFMSAIRDGEGFQIDEVQAELSAEGFRVFRPAEGDGPRFDLIAEKLGRKMAMDVKAPVSLEKLSKARLRTIPTSLSMGWMML